MTAETPPSLVDLLENFEGFRAIPYQDSAGNWTVGIGSIWDWRKNPRARVCETTPAVDYYTARDWVGLETAPIIATIKSVVTVPLNDNQLSALVSFAYNEGVTNFLASSLLKLLNQGNFKAAAAQFPRWNIIHINGIATVLPGLTNRRAAEMALFIKPIEMDTAI
jgi:lysozyme